MTELMRQLTARKLERRKQLAALPVGEKLRMLEEMVAVTKAISATRPPKPAVPVRKGRRLPAS
jgi:hypothetical protein